MPAGANGYLEYSKLLERDPKLRQPQHRNLRAALIGQFGDSLQLAQVG